MSLSSNYKKIELNYMNEQNHIIKEMDLQSLSKTELLDKCKELGMTKYKSKSRDELIIAIQNKMTSKKKVELIIEEDDENEIIANNILDITLSPDIQINKIHNEDCISGMKKIIDESIDIIICDPPYNIGKDFGNDSDKQNMDEYLLLSQILFYNRSYNLIIC